MFELVRSSSLPRLFRCPASFKLERDALGNAPKINAQKGSLSHAFANLLVDQLSTLLDEELHSYELKAVALNPYYDLSTIPAAYEGILEVSPVKDLKFSDVAGLIEHFQNAAFDGKNNVFRFLELSANADTHEAAKEYAKISKSCRKVLEFIDEYNLSAAEVLDDTNLTGGAVVLYDKIASIVVEEVSYYLQGIAEDEGLIGSAFRVFSEYKVNSLSFDADDLNIKATKTLDGAGLSAGYIDYVVSTEAHTYIIEYKTGWHEVDAPESNGQLLAYAYMIDKHGLIVDSEITRQDRIEALSHFKQSYDSGKGLEYKDNRFGMIEPDDAALILVIVQPPLVNPIKEYLLALATTELSSFELNLKQSLAQALNKKAKAIPTPEGCRFCKAKGICVTFNESIVKTVIDSGMVLKTTLRDIGQLDDEAFSVMYYMYPVLSNWLEEFKAEAVVRAEQGRLKGFYLAQGNRNRRWRDSNTVMEYLEGLGADLDDIAPRTLLSPSKIEKSLVVSPEIEQEVVSFLEEHIEEVYNKPSIVANSVNKTRYVAPLREDDKLKQLTQMIEQI